jgi:hypothetical protein
VLPGSRYKALKALPCMWGWMVGGQVVLTSMYVLCCCCMLQFASQKEAEEASPLHLILHAFL